MVSRMFRLVTEVDRTRRDLLRTRLRETNTTASSV
ncbi:N-acetyltransferase, partial [Streptomyces sp. 4F]